MSIRLRLSLSLALLLALTAASCNILSPQSLPTTTVNPTTLAAPTPTAVPLPPPTPTAGPNTTPTGDLNHPPVLYSGHVLLSADTAKTVGPASYMFDFDTNSFSAEDTHANDINFGLTSGSSIFLVIGPVAGASGVPNDKGTQENTINFQDCRDLLPSYSKGGDPIPDRGSHYCWKTTQGRLVGFSVDEISQTQGHYKIGINYVVWDKIVD